jgi:broad specificity phosphatase PhoE
MTTPPDQARITHILTLIRHPETVANVAHLLQGSTDSPLSVHGQNQQNALVQAIERNRNLTTGMTESQLKNVSPLLAGVRPTQILCSPLSRALNLASAIKEAFESEPSLQIPLNARAGLEEKSFGSRECTREGRHVSGFPVGIKPMEDPVRWNERVRQEGKILLDAVTRKTGTNNHLVVVTHGLWISAFFKLFLPNTTRLPFADNTGIFTLAISDDYKYPAKLTRVVCANDTSHLAGLKRQRGGIGSSASDKKQRTLGDMWTKKKG